MSGQTRAGTSHPGHGEPPSTGMLGAGAGMWGVGEESWLFVWRQLSSGFLVHVRLFPLQPVPVLDCMREAQALELVCKKVQKQLEYKVLVI